MKRGLLLYVLIIFVGITFIGKLIHLQLIDNSKKLSPLNNAAVKAVYDYPERGYIYDRNNKLLVANQQSYDVMIIPREVKPLDTLEFCSLLKIDTAYFHKKFKKAKRYSPRLPSVFLNQLSKEDYAYLQEKMHKYKGFYIQKRAIREYPIKSAANILGYVNEVNEELAQKSSYYHQGELVGTQGIEKQYEVALRGKKGIQFKQRNRFNKVIGSYKEGAFDTLSTPGKDLTLTIDTELQQYGEALMQGKRGGIVAIEPSSGEILALITAPSYDPNLMVGRKRSKNSVIFFGDSINKPMFDRGLQAQYAPGSPFKMINGLIGLQESVINKNTAFYCHHGYRYGNRAHEFMGCHCEIVGSPIKLQRGLAKSCNSYFSNVYRRIIEKYPTSQEGMDVWSKHVKSFGLGNYLGYDLPSGQKGRVPNSNYYNRYYPSGSWKAVTTISNAIGQGEIEATPIQLANMTAAIANRGFYFTPHILKKIENIPINDPKFTVAKHTTIAPKHFKPVIEGMHDVFKTGTGKHVNIKGIEICGKTGTAQNFIKRNGKKITLEDHSIFVAFAPKKDPKIAIAVLVENGGFGSTIAAPITSLMIEKYLKGTVTRKWMEKNMLNTSLQHEYDKQLTPPIEH